MFQIAVVVSCCGLVPFLVVFLPSSYHKIHSYFKFSSTNFLGNFTFGYFPITNIDFEFSHVNQVHEYEFIPCNHQQQKKFKKLKLKTNKLFCVEI